MGDQRLDFGFDFIAPFGCDQNLSIQKQHAVQLRACIRCLSASTPMQHGAAVAYVRANPAYTDPGNTNSRLKDTDTCDDVCSQ
jgi:hypothetical protein